MSSTGCELEVTLNMERDTSSGILRNSRYQSFSLFGADIVGRVSGLSYTTSAWCMLIASPSSCAVPVDSQYTYF